MFEGYFNLQQCFVAKEGTPYLSVKDATRVLYSIVVVPVACSFELQLIGVETGNR